MCLDKQFLREKQNSGRQLIVRENADLKKGVWKACRRNLQEKSIWRERGDAAC